MNYFGEINYHLMMVRARLHHVTDPIARASIDNRLANLESFIEYLREEFDRPKVVAVTAQEVTHGSHT